MPDDFMDALTQHFNSQAQALTDAFDRVFDAHHGAPVVEVVAAIGQETGPLGLKADDDWFRSYAEVISAGKSPVGQINEVLCKVIAHNLCVIIASIYELGLEMPTFGNASLAFAG